MYVTKSEPSPIYLGRPLVSYAGLVGILSTLNRHRPFYIDYKVKETTIWVRLLGFLHHITSSLLY